MKKELIAELFAQFENACYNYKGIECWSARELQPILGYLRWENFTNAIEKAKKSCENAGEEVTHHFRDFTKMINLAKGAKREIDDICSLRSQDCRINTWFTDTNYSPGNQPWAD